MGIPLFFKKISDKYDDIIIDTDTVKEVNGLFIDMNCAIHPCCRKVLDEKYLDKHKEKYEKRMMVELKDYLKRIIKITKPKFIYMAVDGVAPAAKMKQQRQRRFKSILEKREINKIKEKLNIPYSSDSWDTNAISPGTEFMSFLSKNIDTFIKTDDIFKDINVIFSSADIPGEGEHKILEYIRHNDIESKGANIIYGLDADLIMLSLASKVNNLYLLREAIEFGKTLDIFLYMDIDELKCSIVNDFKERFLIGKNITITDEKIFNLIDDYIFICFFLGNDFLPHIISLDLRHEGLDVIMDEYIKIYNITSETILSNDSVNTEVLFQFIEALSNYEDKNIEKIFKNRLRLNKTFRIRNVDTEFDKEKELLNNYPVLNMEEEKEITLPNLYVLDWKKRYNKVCFNIINDQDKINNVCKNYIDGIYWTYNYYFKGCSSWSWYYKYQHAPTLFDLTQYFKNIKNINTVKLTLDEPVHPHVQLMTILPPQSRKLLPVKYSKFMTGNHPLTEHLYPINYKLDMLFKRYYWQCSPILPNIDLKLMKRLASRK